MSDTSSKQSDDHSLINLLYAGPCHLPKLCEILLRFRCRNVAYTADIKQAFLQIEVNQSHEDFLWFLWYYSITADNPNIVAFRFTRILFGLNSNQFILKGTLQIYRIKYDFTDHKTDLVQKILCDLYMDNTTNIFKELDTAVMFYALIRKRIQVKEMRNKR